MAADPTAQKSGSFTATHNFGNPASGKVWVIKSLMVYQAVSTTDRMELEIGGDVVTVNTFPSGANTSMNLLQPSSGGDTPEVTNIVANPTEDVVINHGTGSGATFARLTYIEIDLS